MAALIGILEIKKRVGGVSEATILKWKREYSTFPMQKLTGQWVSESETLDRWFALFCSDQLELFQPPKVVEETLPEKPPKNPVKRKSAPKSRKTGINSRK